MITVIQSFFFKFLKDIFNDLEYKLVNKIITNEKESLKKYIFENYR